MKRIRCPNCLAVITNEHNDDDEEWLQFMHERTGRCLAFHPAKARAERKDKKSIDFPFN